MRRRFQFTLLHLMLLMTAVAMAAAWLPKVLPALPWILPVFGYVCLGTAPIAGMCVPSHFCRGVPGFGRGVALCGAFCWCASMLVAGEAAESWIGRDFGVALTVLVGGFTGGLVSGFLAGVVGAIVASVLGDV